ncbi:Pr6Pr family membrane protein [Streptomyces sp. UH6]|uniref:Pr6Pr family membrane protein n=1 Tax=Streptomyces sp. UH6 TaxID=2748379 RepID=UPI0015D50FDC|nr:Pr6Pr family membrane protein [Streptomyces sp. UH6]NYV74566.1 Pr6Pr family membrane protein [Streptomyces sp. UH6]
MTAPLPRDIPDLPPVPGRAKLTPSYVPPTAVIPPARRPLTALFRLSTALAAAGGVAICLALGRPLQALTHFTVQANILLAAVLLVSAQRAWSAGRPVRPALTGAALLYVLLAALVHAFAVPGRPSFSDPGPGAPWATVAALLLTVVVPAAALLDWLLLTAPRTLRLRHATAWLLYPLTYLGLTLGRAVLLPADAPGRAPFPFLDATRNGTLGTVGNALLVALACYGLGVLLVAVDHLCPGVVRSRPKTGFRLRPPVG